VFAKLAIQFVEPKMLGFNGIGDGVAICARLGSTVVPVDFGWLVHHVRSRFWMGGRHVSLRSRKSLADKALRTDKVLRSDKALRPVVARQLPHARDLRCTAPRR